MNKLSKEKRNQLVLVVLVTLFALAGLWFGLINFQRTSLRSLAADKAAAQKKLNDVETAIKNKDQLETELAKASRTLGDLEDDMASGDLYSWMVNTIRQFNLSYRVDIPQFSTIVEADTSLLPGFPYKQVTMRIGGTGYFHDLGKFIADFENRFPYVRVQNLDMEPTSGSVTNEGEKLSFRMDIVTLVKPGAS